MITFHPLKSFAESADVLDWQYSHNRLNNQINEAICITEYLLGIRTEWRHNKKILRMWDNFELHLVDYAFCCLYTWERKKGVIAQSRREKLIILQEKAIRKAQVVNPGNNFPSWVGNEEFHSSHRAVLLGKNFEWYSQFGWSEKPAIRRSNGSWPYIWPEG